MPRMLAPRLPLTGLAGCLARTGLTWEQAAQRLCISPATLHSYTSRGAPGSAITALVLLLDLPHHSPRSLFVRPPEGLGVRALREPHGTHPHQPALRGAVEHCTGPANNEARSLQEMHVLPASGARGDWHQLVLPLGES